MVSALKGFLLAVVALCLVKFGELFWGTTGFYNNFSALIIGGVGVDIVRRIGGNKWVYLITLIIAALTVYMLAA